jgi:hypothetical protein
MRKAIGLVVVSARDVSALDERFERVTNTTVRVLLTPELCEVRVLDLPPLKPADAQAIVLREAMRYFAREVENPVVAVQRVDASRVLAGLASGSLLRELRDAAGRHGVEIESVGSIYEAWNQGEITVVENDAVLEVILRGGRSIQDIRRVPAGNGALLAAVAGEDAGVIAWADAALARTQAGLQFMTVEEQKTAQRRVRRKLAMLSAASIAMLLGASLIQRVGYARELEAIETARQSISSAASAAREVWEGHTRNRELARTVSELHGERTHWSDLLDDVGSYLPDNARVASVLAANDSLVLGVVSTNAIATIEALKETKRLTNVVVIGSINRRQVDSTSVQEEFVISLPAGGRE